MSIGANTAKFLQQAQGVPRSSIEEIIRVQGIDAYRRMAAQFYDANSYIDLVPDVTVERGVIEGSPCGKLSYRIFKKKHYGKSPIPILIYFAGGAGILDLQAPYNRPCSTIADLADCVVIHVSYRLAPEFTRIDAFNDAYFAMKYFYQNAHIFGGSQDLLAVGGNSSGAYLTALVVNHAKQDPSVKIKAQLLITPSVDVSLTLRTKPQYKQAQDVDTMLTLADQTYLTKISLPLGCNPQDPVLSPYYDHLVSLPPTIIITGEYDGLRGDAIEYAEKIKSAGNPLIVHDCPGQIHAAMLCYKVLSDPPYQAELAGRELKRLFYPA
jgi:acetyl esterase